MWGSSRYVADESHIRLCAPGLNHTDPPTPYRTTYVGSAAIDHGRALIPEPRQLPVYAGELNLGVVFHGGPPITGFGPSCTGERCPASKTVTVRFSRGRLVSRRTLKVGERLGLRLGDPGRYLVSAPGCAAARLTVRLKRRISADLVCRLPRNNTV